MEADDVVVFCNSQLIVNQAMGEYTAQDERMIAYVKEFFPENGQAETTNKTILDGIKRRLEAARGKWVEELPNVLWAYQTILKRSTGESPLPMTYGTKAVIPLEIGIPRIRTHELENRTNEAFLARDLDLLEEKMERAAIRLEAYQQ
ncbi:uncharacterized protein LOC114265958 [Camellia sinensis]|uniref:uncharacterized protein LOC114265958 n=1 Tax=Camellia sinensis TaxID=4442 RepID=UPI001036E60C|nr:uncharacterized protein LOC114265958 [Camellia sinensis]